MKLKSVFPCIIIFLCCIQHGFCTRSYTSQEKDTIKRLRKEMGNGEPHRLQYKPYMRNDEYLIRYLRDQGLDVGKAKLKLIDTLNWRKQKKMDEILKVNMSDMHKLFPYDIEGEDKQGDILLLLPYGGWDVRKFMLRGNGRERMARYTAKLFELGLIRSVANNATYGVVILNMNNYNAKQHGCAACLPFYFDLLTQYELYYPESIKSFNFINTPRIWEAVSKLLRPIVSSTTNRLVQVYGYNKREWQTELLKTINSDQLPPRYGGTKKN